MRPDQKPDPFAAFLGPFIEGVRDVVREELAGRPPANDTPTPLMDRAQAAKFLNVSLASLDRFAREDSLPFYLCGDSKRFVKDELMAWLKGRSA